MALPPTVVRTLGKTLKVFETPFAHFQKGGNVSSYFKEGVVMATRNGWRSVGTKRLVNGGWDRCGCCHHGRINRKGNRRTPNTPAPQHRVHANANSSPVALSHMFAKRPHHNITAPEEPFLCAGHRAQSTLALGPVSKPKVPHPWSQSRMTPGPSSAGSAFSARADLAGKCFCPRVTAEVTEAYREALP